MTKTSEGVREKAVKKHLVSIGRFNSLRRGTQKQCKDTLVRLLLRVWEDYMLAAVGGVMKIVTWWLMVWVRKSTKMGEELLTGEQNRKDLVHVLWNFFHKCSECRDKTQGKGNRDETGFDSSTGYNGAENKRLEYERKQLYWGRRREIMKKSKPIHG